MRVNGSSASKQKGKEWALRTYCLMASHRDWRVSIEEVPVFISCADVILGNQKNESRHFDSSHQNCVYKEVQSPSARFQRSLRWHQSKRSWRCTLCYNDVILYEEEALSWHTKNTEYRCSGVAALTWWTQDFFSWLSSSLVVVEVVDVIISE